MRMRCSLPLILLLASLLQGCVLSRAQIKQADAAVAASVDRQSSCSRDDHCATPSPLLDAATQAMADSTPGHPQHVVVLLDDSEASLAARINLIRAAKTSIDVQTYIWDEDDLGQLALSELVDAARRGVNVRILADQLFSFEDPALLAQLVRTSPNLHIRLYNPTFHNSRTSPLEFAAGIACCFLTFNQRMHNKVLVVDNTIGITGGRNYQDRYFNWDNDFDYVDRDIMVGGPAAQDMAKSFDLFWKHRRAVPLTHLRDVNRLILRNPSPPAWPGPHYVYPARVAAAQAEAEDPNWLNEHILDNALHTSKVEYFSDLPAKTEQPSRRQAREFTAHLMQLVNHAKQQVILQTPYLVMSRRAEKIFKKLHHENPPPQIIVSTNSLASTDAFAVYAYSYKHRKNYLTKYGFDIYEMKPRADLATDAYMQANVEDEDDGTAVVAGAAGKKHKRFPGTDRRPGLFGSAGKRNRPAPLTSPGRRFGLHAKSLVIDDDLGMVGSHNFDPRSDHYNTEAGVIVYDPRFAAALRDSILEATQPQNAWVIAPRKPTIPVLGQISQLIGDLSAKLPLFDIWPFRYATSYNLNPSADCPPMQPSNPDFTRCYTAVGDFPDVAVSPKLLYTRLITAFGGGIKGVL
ncbi:phospholipase D-like domain-containing protein [Dyella nitratireducens]|uniref:Phospholipase D family protein n=1 Tax=Dyella nitratireducens TaxID=1849580 RepID=A0ABQ1FXS3_9GAMM|nr:phospholipase D family protein [Dyella nitratireducens]GGA32536.1 phospholipase D family protein [Dyella nitratireducens]GLQ42730.1 phospholipase D family protein [Dyella nitratireducens]